MTQPVQYESELSLQPYMSVGQFGPTYSLYGVICHAGGGPNSGHYYAFIKSKEGRWFEMNDDMVQATSVPVDRKNAYMLFYIQNKGQNLEAAVKAPPVNGNILSMKNNHHSGAAGKRKAPTSDTEDEDQGVKLEAPIIGPLLPSPHINGSSSKSVEPPKIDPQAAALKAKIEALRKNKAKKALDSLAGYASESEQEDDDDDDGKPNGSASSPEKPTADVKEDDCMDIDANDADRSTGAAASSPGPARASSPATAPPASDPSSSAIPPARFYASLNKKKRKHASERENDGGSRSGAAIEARSRGYSTASPYGNKFNKLVKRKKMGI